MMLLGGRRVFRDAVVSATSSLISRAVAVRACSRGARQLVDWMVVPAGLTGQTGHLGDFGTSGKTQDRQSIIDSTIERELSGGFSGLAKDPGCPVRAH